MVYYFNICEFAIQDLTGGFSIDSELEKLKSDLQDSSKCLCLFQQCWVLDDLDSAPDLPFTLTLFSSSKGFNYNLYHSHFHVSQGFFQFSGKVQVFICLLAFFYLHYTIRENDKIH